MKYMLDTNICIYIIKRKPHAVIERFLKTEISQIGISSITLSELLFGVSKSSKPDQNKIALAQFISPLEILAVCCAPGIWVTGRQSAGCWIDGGSRSLTLIHLHKDCTFTGRRIFPTRSFFLRSGSPQSWVSIFAFRMRIPRSCIGWSGFPQPTVSMENRENACTERR